MRLCKLSSLPLRKLDFFGKMRILNFDAKFKKPRRLEATVGRKLNNKPIKKGKNYATKFQRALRAGADKKY